MTYTLVSPVLTMFSISFLVFNIAFAAQRQAPPNVDLDPDSIDFGDQVIKRKSPAKRVTVMNTGGKPLSVGSASIEGGDWRDFRIAKDTCTGATVPPGKACVIDIIFTPADTGDSDATLKLISNSPDSPDEVSLTGNGINAIDVPPFEDRDPF